MRGWLGVLAVVTAAAGSCGGGPASPPALAYRLPSEAEVRYEVADTAVISIEALGQRLALGVESLALYAVSFARAADGLAVRMSLEELEASVAVPMAGPMTFDESSVTGDLVFTLDRRGEVSVVSTPEIDAAARQLVPPEQVAHSFFPALPGVAVAAGARWSDTVAFESADGGGQRTVLDYAVGGDTLVDGASLLHITFTGTSEMTQALSMQGTEIEQTTTLDLEGHVLWDLQRGLMVERATRMSGTGSVQTPLLPARLPTNFEMTSTARLAPR